jgi:hypothetical protein
MNYRKLNNDELIDLLFTEADRLPQRAVEEIVRRGGELVPDLADITMDRVLWMTEPPDWWSSVHATYVLGAIGTDEVLTPLVASLRWSDAYDNEWVTEDLPSIFGSMGKRARKRLEGIVADRSAGWSARAIAMDGLAAIALKETELEEEIVRIIAAILDDPTEDDGARRAAATILIDLRRTDCKEAIVAFAKEDEKKLKFDEHFPALQTREVEKEIAIPKRATAFYKRDWMKFYSEEEIQKRQRRWAEEVAKHKVRPQLRPGEDLHTRPHPQEAGHIDLEATCPCGSGKKYRRCCWQKIH